MPVLFDSWIEQHRSELSNMLNLDFSLKKRWVCVLLGGVNSLSQG